MCGLAPMMSDCGPQFILHHMVDVLFCPYGNGLRHIELEVVSLQRYVCMFRKVYVARTVTWG